MVAQPQCRAPCSNGGSIAVLGAEAEERSAVDRSLTTVLRR